jgi:hypothetical protein
MTIQVPCLVQIPILWLSSPFSQEFPSQKFRQRYGNFFIPFLWNARIRQRGWFVWKSILLRSLGVGEWWGEGTGIGWVSTSKKFWQRLRCEIQALEVDFRHRMSSASVVASYTIQPLIHTYGCFNLKKLGMKRPWYSISLLKPPFQWMGSYTR